MRDKFHGRKGNSPDQQLHIPKSVMEYDVDCTNSSDVGLEAAIHLKSVQLTSRVILRRR